jgi:phosphoglycerate dehydrogenase-like enzyme
MALLRQRLGPHRLLVPAALAASNLVATGPDPLLAEADVAFGQPDPGQVADLPRLRWVHLHSAGYTRYDNSRVREGLGRRGGALTNSSSVYDEPCAEHLLAMMMALARRLPQCWAEQANARDWRSAHHRIHSRLMEGQTALLYGYGAIGKRLTELLQPLRMNLIGVRRSPRGDEPVRVVPEASADQWLSAADHVVNILPASPETENYFDARRLGGTKPGAIYYNVGRGTTVDQAALLEALRSGRLSAAYLDVTDPEPLPPEHPLWSAPNCYITPHTAGGHADEFERLAGHFLDNLDRFVKGEPLADRVM